MYRAVQFLNLNISFQYLLLDVTIFYGLVLLGEDNFGNKSFFEVQTRHLALHFYAGIALSPAGEVPLG